MITWEEFNNRQFKFTSSMCIDNCKVEIYKGVTLEEGEISKILTYTRTNSGEWGEACINYGWNGKIFISLSALYTAIECFQMLRRIDNIIKN